MCVCVCVCVHVCVCVCVFACVCVVERTHAVLTTQRQTKPNGTRRNFVALLVMCLITSIKVAFKQAIQSSNIYRHHTQILKS